MTLMGFRESWSDPMTSRLARSQLFVGDEAIRSECQKLTAAEALEPIVGPNVDHEVKSGSGCPGKIPDGRDDAETLDSRPMHHAEFVVLHNAKLKGFASAEALVQSSGLPIPEVEKALAQLADVGHVMYREGRISGWAATTAGREAHKSHLTQELTESGHGPAIRACYEEFLVHNAELLAVCTAWQVRDIENNEMNDHLDSDYDDGVRDRLAGLHVEVVPICRDLTGQLRRYSAYEPRLDVALGKVRQGLNEWFARPIIDSYHTVWMELHEDLLATLAINRASEPQL